MNSMALQKNKDLDAVVFRHGLQVIFRYGRSALAQRLGSTGRERHLNNSTRLLP